MTLLDLLFVGEAPGASEHITKNPFVGPAGAELQSIIDEAYRDTTELRYNMVNSVLCTPFSDSDLDNIRTPSASEVHQCSRHLSAIIKFTTPKAVIALGKIAARTLKHLQIDHYAVMHPSAILQASHPDLEHARAVLTVKQAIKDISNAH